MPRQIIVGICRFSFFGRSDNVAWRGLTNPGPEVLAGIAADLYATPRLTRRLHSFKRLTLASVRAQTDQDFVLLVLTSPQLPGWARQQLEELCAGCDNVQLIVSDAPTADEALAGPLAAIGALGDQIVQFRLDDDDALHVNYVAALRENAHRMRELPAFAVSFARNLAVSVYPRQPTGLWMIQRPFMAAGLAVRLPPGRGLFSFGHFAMRHKVTNLTDIGQIGALILKWPAESRPGIVGRPDFGYKAMEPEAFGRSLRRGFPFLRRFNFDALRRPADTPRAGRQQGEGAEGAGPPAPDITQGEA